VSMPIQAIMQTISKAAGNAKETATEEEAKLQQGDPMAAAASQQAGQNAAASMSALRRYRVKPG